VTGWGGALPALALVATATLAGAQDDLHRWRVEYEAGLRAEGGYLAVAGLFFLQPGEQAFGSGEANPIRLPPGSSATRVGVFDVRDGRVFFRIDRPGEALVNGRLADRGELRPASSDPPQEADLMRVGRLVLLVHRSGDRLAIRLRDPESPFRRGFTGVRWFDPDPAWRLTARFDPFPQPERLEIVNLLGDVVPMRSPGTVKFVKDGHTHRLRPVSASDGRLWFIFSDETAGTDTYRAARFLYADPPVDGVVVLDFNRAYNPPCAYNPFTTCPLPPPGNRLAVAVRAGERDYPHPAPARE
jgi:uncharacterized protein (DUF1684 family)